MNLSLAMLLLSHICSKPHQPQLMHSTVNIMFISRESHIKCGMQIFMLVWMAMVMMMIMANKITDYPLLLFCLRMMESGKVSILRVFVCL